MKHTKGKMGAHGNWVGPENNPSPIALTQGENRHNDAPFIADCYNVEFETGKTPRQLKEENEKMEGEINAFAEWIGRTGFIKAHSIDRFIPNDTGGFYWFYTGYDSKFSQKYFTSSELREFYNKE